MFPSLRWKSHGALYKVLGEIEAKHGFYSEARSILQRGLELDPSYAPLYHAAALHEAKIGNLDVMISF